MNSEWIGLFGGIIAIQNEILLAAGLLVFIAAVALLWHGTLYFRIRQKTEELRRQQDEVEKLNAQLKISNEELQTSNEELQSSIEELNLLNQDLERKNIELVQTSANLERQKKFNQTIINTTPSVLIVVDTRMRVVFITDGFEDYLGIEQRAEVVELLEDVLPSPMFNLSEIRRGIRETIAGGHGAQISGLAYTPGSGGRRFLNIKISPMSAGPEGDVAQVLMMLEDVTEVKELQIAVEENANYLSGLVDNSLVAIITTDVEGRIALFNEGAERMSSYSKSEVGEMGLADLFTDEACIAINAKAGAGERITEYESVLKTKTGDTIPINVFAAGMIDNDGRYCGTLIIAVDIRERIKIEQELVRRNYELSVRQRVNQVIIGSRDIGSMMEGIVNQCSDGFGVGYCVVMCRMEDRAEFHCVDYINPDRADKSAGYRRLCRDFEDRYKQLENLQELKVSESGVVGYGYEHLAVTLSSRQTCIGLLIVADPLEGSFSGRDRELLDSIGTATAIGFENIYLYEKQRGNLKYLKAVNEITKAINSTLDSEKIFSLIVGSVRELLDCPQVVLYGLDSPEQNAGALATSGIFDGGQRFEKIFPREKFNECIRDAIDGKPRCRGIDQLLRCNVEAREGKFSILCLPIRIEDRVVGMLQVWRPEDEAIGPEETKTIEDLARHIASSIKNANLFRDLQQSYHDLQHAQRQLIRVEKLRALGELSAGVSHDFNNVLAVILGHAQHLMELTEDTEFVEGLRAIERASKDGANTIRRIQEFAQSEVSRKESRVDINQLIRDTVNVIEPRLKRDAQFKGIKIDIKTELTDTAPISADRNSLREALMNILFNSIDALPEGGWIKVASFTRQGRVFVEVTDNGTGMPDDVRERIFDPFYTTKGVEGLGLGMSIVYTAVQQNKGRIEVSSEPGKGTTVTLSFPVDRKARIEKPREPVAAGKPAKVLLIDDNVEMVKALSRILEHGGHRVDAFTDPEQGIDAFSKGDYDIIMTDIGMPDISGWDVAGRIKQLDPQAVIVFITGWGVQLDQENVATAGVKGVINKPISKDEVFDVINSLLTEQS